MPQRKTSLVSVRLHYFQTVVRAGSIRRAAQSLNIAPSAISRSLRQLEDELGTPLFERTRQRLRLTSAGEILLYYARTSASELDRAASFIGDLAGLRRGSVSIAAVESVTRGLLPDVLTLFWKRHPDIRVDVITMGSLQGLEAMLQSDCDMALAFDVRVPKTAQRLASVNLPLGALMRSDHALGRRRTLRLRDLAGERLLLSDASLALGKMIEGAIADAGVELGVRATTNSIALMADLALRNQGVTMQTRVGVERELARRELVFVPLADPQLRPRKLLLVARSKVHLPGAPAAFAKMLGEAMDALKRD
jgi:DNA-binding transcriptional LysR family regulator